MKNILLTAPLNVQTAIDSYMGFRERQGEKLAPESYLIRQEFDINDLEQIKKRSKPIADLYYKERYLEMHG